MIDQRPAKDDEPSCPTPAGRRAAVAFAALALGLIAARQVPSIPPAVWWSVAGAATASAILLSGRGTAIALIAAVMAVGGATFRSRLAPDFHDPLVRLITGPGVEAPLLLSVEGLAQQSPRPAALDAPMSPFGEAPSSGAFSLRAERVLTDRGWVGCNAVLWCRVPGTTYSSAQGLGGFGVRAGQRVRLTGAAEPPAALDNPGQHDARLYAAQSGVAGRLRVDSPELVELISDAPRGWRAALARTRDLLHERALRALDLGPAPDPGPRALVLSLFLGQSEPGERELRGAFTRVGLAHVLAISGVHVVVMAGVGLFLLRLTGERGMLEPLAVALMIVVYLLAVPVSAPVLRAGIMTLALLAGEAMGRRYDRVAIIAWCACAIVLWRPLDLWSLGFQLSFGLTALLLWLGRRTHEALFGPTIRGVVPVRRSAAALVARTAWERFRLAVSASFLCWTVSAPVVALRTGLLSPLAVLTSLVTLPAFTALMWMGYAALLAGLCWPAGAQPLHPVLAALARLCVWLVRRLDEFPGATIRLAPIGAAWAVSATVLLVVWFARARRRDRACALIAAALAVWLAVELVVSRRTTDDRLRVDTLALGDGACTLLRSRDASLLWNAGSSRLDAGQRLIPGALRALGAWRVPTIVLSSPRLQDLSAVLDLVEPLGVRTVLLCGPVAEEARVRPESAAAWLVEHLRARGVDVRAVQAGESLALGDAAISFHASSPGDPRPPSELAPWFGVVRDTLGTPLALLGSDLEQRELASALRGEGGARIIIAGPDAGTVSTPGAVVLVRRPESAAHDTLTLATADRSAWARVDAAGGVTAGRHSE